MEVGKGTEFKFETIMKSYATVGVSLTTRCLDVVEAGGDGTEFCRAEDIPWFYSLSPADQEKVRNGELSDDEDDDDDEVNSNRPYRPKAASGANTGRNSAMRRRAQ
ncbi:hypothetical protein Pmar_PMAR006430 [Perkinsus marinus ATCC 50983]|uniref:Uncharacterized protein n=1 Tax=Perkinsus marinus (strain ATCC 50983 / TXsc) TaxID=423536 RepID=C5K9N6_PERM5|nr:hypothetical protein Pmar_PMAR006430 [Perkinsus marinus ATCC 50983]EER18808.1 hypothetical protein Pmar_PMAR006430 [Perkinsus marinus ATCC 50983]|eukprot:XP_002787012.1 hypothetical protein Pmar_PMAR006430 [Perkinsus marinus ATCC 50983]